MSNIKQSQEYIDRRVNEFHNDSFCLYYKELIHHFILFHPQRWIIKNGKAEPIKHPQLQKLEFELNEYINNKYSDLINGNGS